MSVQVRRRREAAAFLSTFVGAQGELLVDTTNSRVQVHDGATPGGWPAAGIGDLSGRNAAINGSFAINQRGYASSTALAAGAYAHDRWKAGANGCTYTFTQSVPDTIATVTAGTLIQAVDAPNIYATSYWLTWTGTATARVWQGTATGAFAAGTATKLGGIPVNALLITGLTLGTVTNLEFSGGTLGLVQFEAALPNAGPTRFERRQLGVEMALCQRYHQIVYVGSTLGACLTSTLIAFNLTFPVIMRANPAVTLVLTAFSSSLYQINVGGNWISGSPISLYNPALLPYGGSVPTQGWSSLPAGYAAIGNGSSVLFSFDAEL